jgi:hypothetical protein
LTYPTLKELDIQIKAQIQKSDKKQRFYQWIKHQKIWEFLASPL